MESGIWCLLARVAMLGCKNNGRTYGTTFSNCSHRVSALSFTLPLSEIRSQRIFELIRSQVNTNEDVRALIGRLDGRAEVFAAILDWNHRIWLDIPDAKSYV